MTKLRLASVFLVAGCSLMAAAWIMQYRWTRLVEMLDQSVPSQEQVRSMWAFFALTFGLTLAAYALLLAAFVTQVLHILAQRKAARVK